MWRWLRSFARGVSRISVWPELIRGPWWTELPADQQDAVALWSDWQEVAGDIERARQEFERTVDGR